MIKISPILFIFLINILSCKNSKPSINQEKITIIEDIVLGSDLDSMYKDLKKNGVNLEIFYTKISFNDLSETPNNMIGMYYTDIFNFNKYRNSTINLNHFGLLYPIELTGTNRLLGMNVILVSAQDQLFTSKVKLNYPSAIQEVNELLIKDIEKLFIQKYGEPTFRIELNYYPVFHIEGKEIKEYSSAGSKSEIVTWENEYMTVNFYKGIKSYETCFDPKTPQYSFFWKIGGEPEIVKPTDGNLYSYSMPYISYKLKDTTLKMLDLKKKIKL